MIEKILDWWYDLKLIWKLLIIVGVIAVIGITSLIFDSLDLNGYDRLGIAFGVIIFGSLAITIIAVILSIKSQNDYYKDGKHLHRGSTDSYSSSSYDRDSDYSSSSSSSDTSFTEQDIVDALKESLHSKGISAVAIYYSPFVNQWYMVDYWGMRNYVSYVRTGYDETDYFESHSGKRFPVSGILNKDKIYYFS